MIQTNLRKIGNSAGIILSKDIIRQANIEDEISIEVVKGKIVITPIHKNKRAGWKERLIKAGATEDKELLLETVPNNFDGEEWTW